MVAARALLAAFLLAGCQRKAAAPPPPPPDAAAPSPDAAPEIFAGCRAEREHGTTSLECGDTLLVTIVRAQAERAADPSLLRQALDSSRRVLESDGVVIAERSEQAVAGAAIAERFAYRVPEDDETGRGLLAVASGGPTTIIAVLCIDRAESGRCAPMAAAIFTRGLPAGLLPDAGAEPTEVRFAGRAVALPAGCSSNAGEDISCGAANLAWTRVSDDTFANAGDTFFDGMMGAAGGMPKPDFTAELACRIDGVAARCRRRIWAREKTMGLAISGAARVRGEPTALVCFWTVDGTAPGHTVPAACASLLEMGR